MKENLHQYARLLLQEGVNLQQDQLLVINGDVENKDFVYIVVEEAYALGAKDVHINWRSTITAKSRLTNAKDTVLANPAPWIADMYHHIVDSNACILSLISANPFAYEGVPSEKIALSSRSMSKLTKFYHEAIMDSSLTWCVASVATLTWANLLGYEGDDNEKVNRLWNTIFTLCRMKNVSEDESFSIHLNRLAQRTATLNDLQLVSLHYTCPNGTDLTIALPEGHLWLGGKEASKKGIIFDANIPTEEVFTAPHYAGANGTVYSTKPLIYDGNQVEEFYFTFKDGKVVDYGAKEGKEYLTNLIETDENSCYLGEVALVDHYSPISQSNMIFFETLYDENASCHLALGAAYPTCLENSDGMSQEELRNHGLNTSLAHTDFMIGHEHMTIIGLTKDGKEVPIMIDGRLQV
ncbi:aminopeptidase [Veillonella sp. CHU110]|uniref:aminopeptidase n=1 Tax=Veillonella sp. CHU110 TaxID=2490947 RepID=UPI000F8DBCF9|nr:aminopeptidase [Veillonella sp. CHU110]